MLRIQAGGKPSPKLEGGKMARKVRARVRADKLKRKRSDGFSGLIRCRARVYPGPAADRRKAGPYNSGTEGATTRVNACPEATGGRSTSLKARS